MIPSKQLLWNPGARRVTTTPNAILVTDKNIDVDTSTLAITLQLPAPSLLWAGNVADVAGLAWQHNITFSRNGGIYLINGIASDLIVNTPRGGWYLYTDGTDYTVVGPV